jgi:spermidine synthase
VAKEISHSAGHSTTLRVVYFIFFLSGMSGLIYETLWLRVLSRVLGSTVEATSITISAFMLGLSLGSLLIGKYSKDKRNLLRLYALLELGIAVSALVVYILFEQLIPVYREIFKIVHENAFLFRFFQATILFCLIVIPTFLMGGTLPVLSSALLTHERTFTRLMGYLYGINSLGAVAGVFLSGFFTIGSIGELNTMFLGTVLNLSVGAIALTLARREVTSTVEISPEVAQRSSNAKQETISTYPERTRNAIALSYAMVGFCSFALEVVWIRLFQLPLGTAIYSFSAVLTVYIFASAFGSYVFGRYFTRLKSPIESTGLAILGIGLWGLAGLYLFTSAVPWQINPSIVFRFSDLLTPLVVIFPLTFMLGFIFPLVTRIYVAAKTETGAKIGKLYSLNTLGCILGSLFSGYVFIPLLGTRDTIILISVITCLLGFLLLGYDHKLFSKNASMVVRLVCSGIALIMIMNAADPYYVVVNKFVAANHDKGYQIKHHKETSEATVTALVSTRSPLDKHLLVNGVGMTSLVPETKIMAHLPILLHRNPSNMLIICYGMGTCLRSAVSHKDLRIDQVELVGEEYKISNLYHRDGLQTLTNERVRYFVDDGRNFLLMRSKKYDIVSIDPSPPIWSAGTVNLYTREFFQLVKHHLNDDGILCLWIPPGPSTELKMIMKSFQNVFPKTDVYRGPFFAGFYMMGYINYYPPDPQRFAAAASDSLIMGDLNEWGRIFNSPIQLLSSKLLDAAQLAKVLTNVEEVTDNHPYTEFPLWRGINNPEFKVLLYAGNIIPK